jgi:hypothetical protein
MDLKEKICQKLIFSDVWINSLSYCEPGIYGIKYWEVSISDRNIDILGHKFTFKNAYFFFEVQLFSSNEHECSINTFAKEAFGEGIFDYINNKIEIYNIKIDYDRSLFPLDDPPLLGGYFLDELRELYQKRTAIKNIGQEVFNFYIESVNQQYESLEIEKYLHENIRKLEVGNHGSIKYDGEPLKPSLVKERLEKNEYWAKWMEQWKDYLEIKIPDYFIPYPLLLVHRLVAEVWCENPDKDIYTRVHHIGNNENIAENLLFVTEKQHALIHKNNW